MVTYGLVIPGLLALTFFTFAATAATADEVGVIKVSLSDKGSETSLGDFPNGLGMGMHGDLTMATVSVNVDRTSIPAGKVTFTVTNDSKGTIHEMLVAPINDRNAVLPFLENENRLDEEATNDLGEVPELDPGKSGSLTVELKPGLYVLYCNIAGHYMAGMWSTLEVTEPIASSN
jgi:uncharacterized cupredoxin-like copper-binding protein